MRNIWKNSHKTNTITSISQIHLVHFNFTQQQKRLVATKYVSFIRVHMGVSLNGGTLQTPQNDHF